MEVTRKQSTQTFRKMNFSYPLIRTRAPYTNLFISFMRNTWQDNFKKEVPQFEVRYIMNVRAKLSKYSWLN